MASKFDKYPVIAVSDVRVGDIVYRRSSAPGSRGFVQRIERIEPPATPQLVGVITFLNGPRLIRRSGAWVTGWARCNVVHSFNGNSEWGSRDELRLVERPGDETAR